MPSFNGQGVARGVARLFCLLACGGELEGTRLLSQALVDHAMTEAWYQTDALGLTCRMSNGGFMLRNPELTSYNHNPRSFGHLGLGGAIAFGDPDAKLGFSFCGNRMAPIGDLGPYASPLATGNRSLTVRTLPFVCRCESPDRKRADFSSAHSFSSAL